MNLTNMGLGVPSFLFWPTRWLRLISHIGKSRMLSFWWITWSTISSVFSSVCSGQSGLNIRIAFRLPYCSSSSSSNVSLETSVSKSFIYSVFFSIWHSGSKLLRRSDIMSLSWSASSNHSVISPLLRIGPSLSSSGLEDLDGLRFVLGWPT